MRRPSPQYKILFDLMHTELPQVEIARLYGVTKQRVGQVYEAAMEAGLLDPKRAAKMKSVKLDRDRELIEDAQAGMPLVDLVAKYEIGIGGVRTVLKKYGVPMRDGPRLNHRVLRILKLLFDESMGFNEIAEATGVTTGRVGHISTAAQQIGIPGLPKRAKFYRKRRLNRKHAEATP